VLNNADNGTLDLRGNGEFRLLGGGRINGGTVRTTEGAALGGATWGQGEAVLDGVTVGDLDLTHVGREFLVGTGGRTLNATAALGRYVQFQRFFGALLLDGAQTLGGTGTVRFGGSYYTDGHNAIASRSGTLTIGPNITIQGAFGTVGASAYWAASGTFDLQ